MPGSKLTIGQAAEAAGLTRKAVRVYEAKGLLRPASRTSTGYRLYDEHDVELLTFIRRARSLGLHLNDIRQIIVIRSGGNPPCEAVREMVEERIADIDTTIGELRSLRQSLVDTRRDADDCCADVDPTRICRAIEEADSVSYRVRAILPTTKRAIAEVSGSDAPALPPIRNASTSTR